MQRPHIHIDFETRSEVDLLKSGSFVYADHESTRALCMAYAFDEEEPEIWIEGEPFPERLVPYLSSRPASFLAWNAGFENCIWNTTCIRRYGWPRLPLSRLYCPMAMSYAMALPGKLETAALVLGVTQQKDMTGHRVMLQLSKPRKARKDEDKSKVYYINNPEKFKILYKYCLQDVRTERAVTKHLRPLSEFERKVWLFDQKVNSRGVPIHKHAVENALRLRDYSLEDLNERLEKITNHQVGTVNSIKQFVDWLALDKGIETDTINADKVAEILDYPDLDPDVREALEIRQMAGKSSTSKLNAMLRGLSSDSRARGCFQYHGAGSTGRFAGRRVQFQNVPRPTLPQNEIEAVVSILETVE